jgi:prepilin-type N-terminal cleavage/methylation domain-containing protein
VPAARPSKTLVVAAARRRGEIAGVNCGLTLVELLFALAVAATLTTMAIPEGVRARDEYRTRGAAQYLASRVGQARLGAIRRARFVGLRFESVAGDYAFTSVEDGNGNGLKTAEILAGTDPSVTRAERLDAKFEGVGFGILAGIPDADGVPVDSPDGVRLGSADILSMNPNGSSSSGTVYVHGRERSQYAVRVLGATGRVRVLKFVEASRQWVEQ